MNNAAIDLLEDLGFVDEREAQEQFLKLSRGMREDLRSMLRMTLAQSGQDNLASTPFTFLASSQFRGDRCCSMADCRVSAIPKVSRFAALYADRLFFPILLGNKDHNAERELLEGAVRVLLELRPLIRAGIVVPTNTNPSLCRQCHEGIHPLYEQAYRNASLLIEKHVGEFRVDVKELGRKNRRLEYVIDGPADFLSEGRVVYVTRGLPSWASEGQFRTKTRLLPENIINFGLLNEVFNITAKDFILQNTTGRYFGATYITDQKGEAEFFSLDSLETERARRRVDALSKLAHVLPSFPDLSLNGLIRLRKKEHAAFQNYREAVSLAIRESETVATDGIDATALYEDVIRPRVIELEARDQAEKGTRRKKLASRAVFAAFGATFGALMTGLHPGIGAAIGAAISCLNPTATDDIVGSVDSSSEVKSDSLYFLLTAKRAAVEEYE